MSLLFKVSKTKTAFIDGRYSVGLNVLPANFFSKYKTKKRSDNRRFKKIINAKKILLIGRA